jgi:hypothetical protein
MNLKAMHQVDTTYTVFPNNLANTEPNMNIELEDKRLIEWRERLREIRRQDRLYKTLRENSYD